MQLQHKVAVITGAARGIGRACALRFAREGAALALVDVAGDIEGVPYSLGSRGQLEHTASLCRAAAAAVLTAELDIRNSQGVADVVDQCLARFGCIDILINNAGIVAPSGRLVHEISDGDWQTMLDVDLTGTWRMLRAVAPHMLKRHRGSIINIASTAGMVGYRYFAAYVAAKHAVVGLTRAAALDFAPQQVRVNALCPGSVRDTLEHEGTMLSEIARALDLGGADPERLLCESQPMNALPDPEDIAAAALWLAGDDSRQVTGSVTAVDGGFTAK